ncbi:MAG: radical SAM protein [Thermoprotei archaeon]|nr:MAG: radical SAM protein [Thermoprotei archaeon]
MAFRESLSEIGGLIALKRALALKKALVKSLEKELESWRQRKARGDGHAKRPPRPCGLTVHTCVGCPFSCLYCYIEELGFPRGRAHPYALSGSEWTYAILMNPRFLPGVWGTYLAFGSVCEPLHGDCTGKTLEYLHEVGEKLGNLCQLSTKSSVSDEVVKNLARLKGVQVNVLVTVITLRHHRALEPSAPSPEDRFDTLRKLRREGVPAFLFLRPLIPGLVEDELEDLMNEAKRAGAMGVVIGGLRVSERILRRLKTMGLNTHIIEEKLPKEVGGRRLIDVPSSNLKKKAIEIAEEVGLMPLRSACCATTFSYMLKTGKRLPCAGLCFTSQLCYEKCPVKCKEHLPPVDKEDVKEALNLLLGKRPDKIEIEEFRIVAHLKADKVNKTVETLFNTAFRRRLYLKLH